MGRYSDRYGARALATSGAGMLIIATFVYLTLRLDTPLWVVLVASGIFRYRVSDVLPVK